ncbi:MAG TPA: hypothetical protein VFQ13_18250 [Anaerolineales bacterium]|nr:hypothetical protein [Anaerolineales bacterium]
MAETKATARRAATQDHAAFTQSIKSSLAIAREKVERIRRTDMQLFVANVVSPAAATLIAALAAAMGGDELFKQAATHAEDGGWVLACGLVAVFGFIATVSGVFKKQFDDRLVLGNQCVGRLLALDLAVASGNTEWEEAAREYGEVLKAFPEFIS